MTTARPGTARKVQVQTLDGKVQVSALCYGQLAIHRWTDGAWHLSYLGNGQAVIISPSHAREVPCILVEAAKGLRTIFRDVPGRAKKLDDPAYLEWHNRSKSVILGWQDLIDSER